MSNAKSARRSRSKKTSQESRVSHQQNDDVVAPRPTMRPAGKLGLIIDRLATRAGATADELAESTGWRKNTVLGALSRLRTRGFAMRLETRGDRRAYWLERGED
jgi:hypothetical protein